MIRDDERALGGPWTDLGTVSVAGGAIAYAACGAGPPAGSKTGGRWRQRCGRATG